MNKFHVLLKTRSTLPAYTLRGYKLLCVFYAQGNIPVEVQTVEVPELAPGKDVRLDLAFTQAEVPLRVQFDVRRPTGFSAWFCGLEALSSTSGSGDVGRVP